MSHLPVDHHLRPMYRAVAALAGGAVTAFGVVGLVETAGAEWFGQGDWSSLGVATNRALAVAGLVFGVVVVLASLIGRNLDQVVTFYGGIGLLLVGTAMLALSETELNVLSATVGTAAAAYVVGFVLLACGLYTRTSVRARRAGPGSGAAPTEHVPAAPAAEHTGSGVREHQRA